MTGLTTYDALPPKVQAYYDKRFLLKRKQDLQFYQFGQKRSLPNGVGKTVYFSRIQPLNKVTSALTDAVASESPYSIGGLTLAGRQSLSAVEISATVAMWGDYITVSRLTDLTCLNGALTEKVDAVADQAARSVDYEVSTTAVGKGLGRMRADADATYTVAGTASGGSTTTIVDAGILTQADSAWVGAYVVVTEGTNYGEVRIVTASDQSDTSITFAAMPVACDTTTKYRVVSTTGLAATDVPTTANVRLALRYLKRANTPRYENGMFIGFVNPETDYDWFGDTTFVAAGEYKDSVDMLYTGEIGKRLGIRWINASQVQRETITTGALDEDGAIHCVPIIGKESYGVVELEGAGKKIYVKTPEQLAQPIPMFGSVGWESGFVAKALNGNFGINIMCGATA